LEYLEPILLKARESSRDSQTLIRMLLRRETSHSFPPEARVTSEVTRSPSTPDQIGARCLRLCLKLWQDNRSFLPI
jgi:hypothetical protein